MRSLALLTLLLVQQPVPPPYVPEDLPLYEIHTWTVDAPGNPRTYAHAFHPASGASSFPRMAERLSWDALELARYEVRRGHYIGHAWHPGCGEEAR